MLAGDPRVPRVLMSLSYAQHGALIAEVAAALPAGVQKVFERDGSGFVLQLRGLGRTTYVLVDTTSWARVCLAAAKPQQPPAPSSFVMLLRKLLVGGGLTEVSLAADDRVVTLRFARREDGELVSYTLVVELFGVPNAVLVGEDGAVIATQHSAPRLARGATYAPPRPPAQLAMDDALDLAEVAIGERAEVVEGWLSTTLQVEHASALRAVLSAGLRREHRKARRLVTNLEADLARAEQAQQYRRFGELLQSAYGQPLPRGATVATVPDYYADGTPLVEVPLDPARSLKENIARYFHEYRRMNAAIGDIEERLLAAMARAEALEAAREQLASAAEAELEALQQQWVAQKLWRPQQQASRGSRGRSNQAAQLPYRTFIGHSGAKILVGRGSKHNDALTTRVARGRDVWLHARDWAGAHVVLRMERDDEPNSADLRDAALLAAHFSKGRGDSLVDVTYTRAKWVRKPKGAAPGLVTVAGGATFAVSPDEDRIAILFEREVVEP